MKATAIFIALLAISAGALAQEYSKFSIVAHGVSKHSRLEVRSARGGAPTEHKFNENNYGAAIRYNIDSALSVQAGGYYNSYYKPTVYAIGQYMPLGGDTLRVGVFGGLASGYHGALKVPVVGGLVADINIFEGVTYTVRHAPKIGAKTASVTSFEIAFKF